MARALLALNLAGAIAAFAANVWASHMGDRTLRGRYLAIAMLAAAFVVAIAGQLLTWPDVEDWLVVTRGLGIAAWGIVWVWPAVAATRRWRRMRAEVVETLNTARDAMGEEPVR